MFSLASLVDKDFPVKKNMMLLMAE